MNVPQHIISKYKYYNNMRTALNIPERLPNQVITIFQRTSMIEHIYQTNTINENYFDQNICSKMYVNKKVAIYVQCE